MMKHTKLTKHTRKDHTIKESADTTEETSVLLQEKTLDVGIINHSSSFT